MNHIARSLLAFVALAFVWSSAPVQAAAPASQAAGIPAFPGAQGFGTTTPGGRGGEVYEVTNLDDSGPGSLRDALGQGHRTIVFRVSGTIQLKSNLDIKEPFITIAGQTAPGDGICLRDYTLGIRTHDVVIRYIRSRLGDETAQQSDAITLWHGCRNIVMDHCSASWSIDEGLSTAGDVGDTTIQWCLIAEALRHSKHHKGDHGYGSLARANGAVSWHNNLWAHNDARNPRLGDNYGKPPFPLFDFRNNVIYDYGKICSGLTQGRLHVNYVNNYIRPGPSSRANTPIRVGAPSELIFYITGNIFDGNQRLTDDNSQFFSAVEISGKRQVQTVSEPFDVAPVTTLPAQQAYDAVVAEVGASLPRRDAVDTQIIDEVRSRSGKMIDSQTEVGGWPQLKSQPAPADADHDGMPDAWETSHGLNPSDPADANADADNDGYTNLEEYLNNTDPKQFIDYREPANNVSSLGPSAPTMLIQAPATAPATAPAKALSEDVNEKQVLDVLQRVLSFCDKAMPARVIDRTTGQEITDFSTPNRNAFMDRGENNAFTPLDYTTGVIHAGMLRCWEVSGDQRFADFTRRHMQFIHDRLPYFRAQAQEFGERGNAFDKIFNTDSLDDSGSMCAAMIKARRAEIGPDLMPVIDHWIDYISNKQFRLDDGTLARHRPQPQSIWADDLYMSVPALAQMGKLTGQRQYYDDAAKQMLQISHYLFNHDKGLYMHGRNMNQPDNPEFYWGRGNGWAMMANVELLDVLPEDHPDRPELLSILKAQIKAIAPLQSGTGLWHQMLDKPDSYLETSCSAMFVYSIAKAIDRGWISPVGYGAVAQAGWNALASRVDARGAVEGTCVGTTFASDNVYYYNRKTSIYAGHGYGPVLLAGAEMIQLLRNQSMDMKVTNGAIHYVPKAQ